jgi:hypothetical protein
VADQSTVGQEREANLRKAVSGGAVFGGAESWWSALAERQQELGSFVSDRLAQEGEAIGQTLRSRMWTEALDVQVKSVDETFRDHRAALGKLSGLPAGSSTSAVQGERLQSLSHDGSRRWRGGCCVESHCRDQTKRSKRR